MPGQVMDDGIFCGACNNLIEMGNVYMCNMLGLREKMYIDVYEKTDREDVYVVSPRRDVYMCDMRKKSLYKDNSLWSTAAAKLPLPPNVIKNNSLKSCSMPLQCELLYMTRWNCSLKKCQEREARSGQASVQVAHSLKRCACMCACNPGK